MSPCVEEMRRPAVTGSAQSSSASATAAACRRVFGMFRNIFRALVLRTLSAPEFRGLGPRREQAAVTARVGRRKLTLVLYMGMETLLLRIPCVFLLGSLSARPRRFSGLLQKLFVDSLSLGRGLDAQLLAQKFAKRLELLAHGDAVSLRRV